MKALLIGVASLFCLSGCGSTIVVGNETAGGAGLGSAGESGGSGGAGASAAGSGGGSNPGENNPSSVPGCSASPTSFETYSSREELDALLIGKWRRCTAPQIPGEDIGVEFSADGNFYPLTSDENQQVVRRSGVDYQGAWIYSPPGTESPISHQPSEQAFMELNGVITDAPTFTNDPRQLRINFSPVPGRYVPLTQ